MGNSPSRESGDGGGGGGGGGEASEASTATATATATNTAGASSPPASFDERGGDGGGGNGEAATEAGAPSAPLRDSGGLTLPGLDAGDVVLFNRRCMAMSPYGAVICGVAKAMSNSRWDHVGVVVRTDDGVLHLLEANLSGVTMRPLEERLRRSRSNEIAVRRLFMLRNDKFRRELLQFAEQVVETPYQNDIASMLGSVIRPIEKQERERLHALLVSKQAERAEIERELRDGALTAFQRRSLSQEKQRLKHSEEKLEEQLRQRLASSNGGIFEGSNDLSRVFCSELVAAAYQRIGLLGPYPPSGGYSPKDFSTEQANPPGVHLLNNARLGEEEFIRRLEGGKRRQRQQQQQREAAPTGEGKSVDARARAGEPFAHVSDRPRGESLELVRDALKRTPIYSALPDEYIRNHLLKSFRPVVVEKGDILFHQGDYGDAFYIVESGSLDRFIAKDGQDAIHVTTLEPRNSFGLTTLFFHAAGRSSTVRARERTLLWRLDRATFERFALDFGDTKSILSAADQRHLRNALKQHFLFSRLDRIGPRELDAFFTLAFRPGETVFEQGDGGDNFYIIKSGELERWISKPGHRPKLAGTLKPGDSFGELSLMYNARRGATVRARSEVEMWAISAESFHRLHLGGGARFLQRIFEHYASVAHGAGHADREEAFMTATDFLRFAKADAFLDSPEEYQRLCTLLLRLVTNNSRGAATAANPQARDSEALIDFWQFVRFDIVLNQPDAESQIAFRLCDRDNSGVVGMEEFQEMFIEYANGDPEIERLVEDGSPLLQSLFGRHGTRKLNFREFTAATAGKLPKQFTDDIRKLDKHMLQHAAQYSPDAEVDDPVTSMSLAMHHAPSGAAGPRQSSGALSGSHILTMALAGAMSRTAVAPLDRLKILMQTEAAPGTGVGGAGAGGKKARRYRGVLRGIRRMLADDGFRGMYRGNAANALRIMPAAAIQAFTVDALRRRTRELADVNDVVGDSKIWDSVVVGGCGGIAAATLTYPLDFMRARLAVQHRATADPYLGIGHGLRTVALDEGARAMYRGVWPTILGVFPYVGINFAVYEVLRPIAPRRNDGSGLPTAGGVIFCGVMASSVGQLAAYPFDTCRLRMQVDRGAGGGTWRVMRHAVRQDGVRSLYRGLLPNMLKALPSAAVSFYAYEMLREPMRRLVEAAAASMPSIAPSGASAEASSAAAAASSAGTSASADTSSKQG